MRTLFPGFEITGRAERILEVLAMIDPEDREKAARTMAGEFFRLLGPDGSLQMFEAGWVTTTHIERWQIPIPPAAHRARDPERDPLQLIAENVFDEMDSSTYMRFLLHDFEKVVGLFESLGRALVTPVTCSRPELLRFCQHLCLIDERFAIDRCEEVIRSLDTGNQAYPFADQRLRSGEDVDTIATARRLHDLLRDHYSSLARGPRRRDQGRSRSP